MNRVSLPHPTLLPNLLAGFRIVGLRFAVLVLGACVSTEACAFEPRVTAFFSTYCHDCHANGAAEGGLQLSALDGNLLDEASFAKWELVYDRVAEGQMPPSDADQPTASQRAELLQVIGSQLTKVHADRKGTVLRRLNRREYSNTLNDLFGTSLQLDELLPEDGRTDEFDNVGETLHISMVQLERYLQAIDLVMTTAIAKTTERPQSHLGRYRYAEMDGADRFIGNQWLQRDDGAIVFFKQYGYPTGLLKQASAKATGKHRIRIYGYAYQSDQPITFSVGATSFAPGADKPTFGYFSMPPGEPSTIELDGWLEHRHMIEITPWGIHDNNYELKQGVEKYAGAGLAILWVELEGPLHDQYPSRGHRMIYDSLERLELEPRNAKEKQRPGYVGKFELKSADPEADAQRVLQRVATQAFRRPVAQSELTEYVDLFKRQFQSDSTMEEALHTAVSAIFCSPEFLYLQEPAGRLSDHALASRLSYFLTRTTPDDELLSLAAKTQLTTHPPTLAQQVDRLLNDPRSERFVNDFLDAWLNLRDIEFTSPDQNLFPEFDSYLQYSMLAESRAFFRKLLVENCRIESLIQSDFAMLNERLAQHYEIDGVAGPEIRAVPLSKDSVRGGILSQAAVLKVSANGTNTSPVVRGVYVTERILGRKPSPPPPGVPGVEPDIRGATTLRQLLDKHRDQDQCRACHAMIDPPGFALENFNPIGGWQERFRSLGEGETVKIEVNGRKVRYKLGPEVDASGQLIDGRTFSGYQSFREWLQEDRARLAQAFVTKVLTFATGREMGFSDRPEIQRIVKASAENGYRMRELLHLVVASELFQNK